MFLTKVKKCIIYIDMIARVWLLRIIRLSGSNMQTNPTRIFKLNLNHRKAVQAVDYIAQKWPRVTQYYVCKIIYFADKAHCLDWGRTITGDRYVAMDHGPVSSRVYEMLKLGSGEEDELLDMISSRLSFEIEGNKIHMHSKGATEFDALSASDCEALDSAIAFCRPLSFSKLRDISHRERAWIAASQDELRSNPPMDLADWFDGDDEDREQGAAELVENAKHGVWST